MKIFFIISLLFSFSFSSIVSPALKEKILSSYKTKLPIFVDNGIYIVDIDIVNDVFIYVNSVNLNKVSSFNKMNMYNKRKNDLCSTQYKTLKRGIAYRYDFYNKRNRESLFSVSISMKDCR